MQKELLVARLGVGLALIVGVPTWAATGKILPSPQQVSTHVYAWIGPYGGPSKENHGYRMNMTFVIGA